MDAEYLLRRIQSNKMVAVSEEMIKSIREFRGLETVNSLESVALQVSGHTPVKIDIFDINVLIKWCKENNLHVAYQWEKREFYFKEKK